MPPRRTALLLVAFLMGCGDDGGDPDAGIGCPGDPLPQPPGLDPAVEARIDALIAQMTLDDKIAQMQGTGLTPVDGLWPTGDNPRLAIPGFHMVDGPRGVRAGHSTSFPVGMARGASFDRDLERAIGEAIGLEAAAHGADVLLAPTINVLRHPAWGRAQETYGEDPYQLGELGAAFVAGAQPHVIATAKHYAANSIEDTRFDVDVTLDERTLREVYLPHFRTLVDAGVGAVMTAYNQVNDHYASENPHLVREILLDEWGFSGLVMSDWVFGTHSAGPAVNAGLDIEMPFGVAFGDLEPAVRSCEVSLATLDDAVRRILRVKARFGLLDGRPPVDPSVIESADHAALALRAARESIVLLKNDAGLLPIAGSGSIAVVGALADVANTGDHGSSAVDPSHAVTPLAGLQARFPTRIVPVTTDTLADPDRAAIAAAGTAIVVVGLTYADEGEAIPGGDNGGDRETLALSAAHQALIAEVTFANPRTIVVIEGGSAVLTSPWIAGAGAVLMAWYPGQEGGTALAEIVAGDVNPSGRLPISFPVAEADLPPFDHTSLEVEYGYLHGYRWLDHEAIAPAFAFGAGLSYGTVDYVDVSLASSTVAADGTVSATVEVASIDRTGDEVVQLYVEPPAVVGVIRAPRTLQGFARVTLTPGQHAEVTLTVPVAALGRYDAAAARWIVDPGTYTVAAGRSSRDLPLRAAFTVR